ncbi:MAG: hypothetical protein AAFU85_16065 [Planctomycetota bacterium]
MKVLRRFSWPHRDVELDVAQLIVATKIDEFPAITITIRWYAREAPAGTFFQRVLGIGSSSLPASLRGRLGAFINWLSEPLACLVDCRD